MMKILHIIDSSNLYGAEIMLLNLIEEQRRSGLIPVLCNIGVSKKAENSIDEEAIKRGIKIINIKFKRGFDIINALKLWKEAIFIKTDIIHSHSYKSDIIYGVIPKYFRKLPMIATLHGLTDTRRYYKLNIYDSLACMTYRYIDALVLVDKSMLHNKKLLNIRHCNIHVIENGIEEMNSNILNGGLDINNAYRNTSDIIIGAIGRLNYEKGYHVLIEAINVLVKNGKNIKLIIIGDGPERERLKRIIIKYRLIDNIFLVGYKIYAKKHLREFDAFVMPSFREGLPITILEAMQAGVPIIATDVGGIPEMLQYGKAGIIIKPNNIQLLVDAINNVLDNNKMRENIVNNARNIVKEIYSSDVMARKYTCLYNNVLANHILQ